MGSTSKKQPTTEDTTMSQNSSIYYHHHNILNINPIAILEEILQTNTFPEVQINKLTNALINTHTEAASQINQLKQALKDMAATLAQIQTKIDSDAESNQTRDLNHYH